MDLQQNKRGLYLLFMNFFVPKPAEVVLFIHAIGVVSTAVRNKCLRVIQLYFNGTGICICLQLLTNARCVLLDKRGFQDISAES